MSWIVRSNIEDTFGKSNVAKWADLDGNKVEDDITTHINRSITVIEALVNDTLRHSIIDISVVADADMPDTLVEIGATLAGVWLYQSRGVADFNEVTGDPTHRLIWQKRDAEARLRKVQTGEIRVDLDRGTLIPAVLSET